MDIAPYHTPMYAAAAAAAAGFGLVWAMVLGRLELNYCWVLTSQQHDRLRRGFSFGFASNMGL
jgi:outer membrane protein assembly factor BamA